MATNGNWISQTDEFQALQAIYESDFTVIDAIGIDLPADDGTGKDIFDACALASAPPPRTPWSLACRLSIHVTIPESGCFLCLGNCTADNSLLQPPQPPRPSEKKFDGPKATDPPTTDDQTHQEENNRLRDERSCTAAVYCVRHLPPISLFMRFTHAYPESPEPPEHHVSAIWLPRSHCVELEAQLEQLWEAHCPVGHTWAEWLQTSALDHLGLAGCGAPLILSEDDDYGDVAPAVETEGKYNGEERRNDHGGRSDVSLSGSESRRSSSESRLLALLQYSAARDLQIFQSRMHTCSICFEDQPGSRFVRLDCGHRTFCCDCLGQQALVLVESGELDALKCPDTSCRAPIDAHILRRLLDPSVFERWESLTLQRALETMSDAAYCPRCGMLCLEDPTDNCADCPKCFFIFCTLCNEARHPGVECVSAETRLAMLRQKAQGGGAAAVEELLRREHEFLSLAEIEKTSKRCPACGMAVQRSEGCNKMSCANCGSFFCWKCGKQISGYDHFKAGGDCSLFDESEILRWERHWEQLVGFHEAAQLRNDFFMERMVGDDQRQAPMVPAVHCPSCGQPNYKLFGNNHMHCWSCTRHFCALCRVVLQRRRGGAHFGPNGCRQHS